MDGYDVELVSRVSSAVSIPVIACGGAGNAEDCVRVVKAGGASAVAAASIFQYTQTTPMTIKERFRAEDIAVRV